MRSIATACLMVALTASTLGSRTATAETFPSGSLIIPMDTSYQDMGMLEAYGLLYQLLLQNVTVHWVIEAGKNIGDTDLTASAIDVQSGTVITEHGYRGGPLVITQADAARAMPIITSWQSAHTTAVHQATSDFEGHVKVRMIAAPRIAVFADGNESIAFGYLNAAGIPDSRGLPWTDGSPDALSVLDVRGPSDSNHSDGALFDDNGRPAFCEFMSMHWAVKDREKPGGEEVVAEVRSFLEYRTHFFAECQAVNAFENAINGRFLTTNGFVIGGDPSPPLFLNSWYPFAQLDGPFQTVGGSERSYSLMSNPLSVYKDLDIVMITKNGTTPLTGNQDLWMTGYLDGRCEIGQQSELCLSSVGKISYLGGHAYTTKLPISANGQTQGTRLFLNSLFEADCVTDWAAPSLVVHKSSEAFTTQAELVFRFDYHNLGGTVSYDVVVSDTLPPGTTFVSASHGGTFAAGVVTWNLGNVGAGEFGSFELVVEASADGVYQNSAEVSYLAGNTVLTANTNVSTVEYQQDSDGDGCSDQQESLMGTLPNKPDTDDDGVLDCDDICPLDANPLQSLLNDWANCGACHAACPSLSHECSGGVCRLNGCIEGWADCDGLESNGCEYPVADFASDPEQCGGCGISCAAPQASSACVAGQCQLASCQSGFFDCDGNWANGCELSETQLLSNDEHCGACDNACALSNASAACVEGNCEVIACASGWKNTDGVAENGCECEIAGLDNQCNGLDDNCDGDVDEGYNSPLSCGLGACARPYVCEDGVESCVEGPATDELCDDGLDNDCDGFADLDDADCGGACATAADCEDGNPCTLELCRSDGNCERTQLDDDTPCVGLDACAASGSCQNGVCEYTTSCVEPDEEPTEELENADIVDAVDENENEVELADEPLEELADAMEGGDVALDTLELDTEEDTSQLDEGPTLPVTNSEESCGCRLQRSQGKSRWPLLLLSLGVGTALLTRRRRHAA